MTRTKPKRHFPLCLKYRQKNKEKIGRKAEDKMKKHELAKGSDKDGGTASRMQRQRERKKKKEN